MYFYPDYWLLKSVADPTETIGNFAGLDRRICLDPNTLKKGVIDYLSMVEFLEKGYRLFQKRVGTFLKMGRHSAQAE